VAAAPVQNQNLDPDLQRENEEDIPGRNRTKGRTNIGELLA
jgi:hypothetical protein